MEGVPRSRTPAGDGVGGGSGSGCFTDSVQRVQRKLSQIGSKFDVQDWEHVSQAKNLASVERVSCAVYKSIICQ